MSEIELEQSYIDRAYARLEAMLAEAHYAAARAAAASESAGPLRDALVESALSRAHHLAIGDEPLVFGRLDFADGTRMHIGRAAVYDEDHEPLVIDWRAPAAEAFYRATPGNPMGVVRRRHLVCRGRRVLRLDDELLDEEAAAGRDLVLVGEGALLEAIGRARTGRMRDIVATIQAEQDAVIRAPLDGALVVQGGPGTGKTAVALHRAAYLLYTHRAGLERSGVLIVGPNPIFLTYIDRVLPSLGETATLATASELAGGLRVASADTLEATRVKGDARMSDVIELGVRNLARPLGEDATLDYEGSKVVISVAASRRMIELARKRFRGRHNARQRDVSGLALTYVWNRWREANPDTVDILGAEARRHFESTVRTSRSFKRVVNAMWPAVSSDEFVRDLLSSREALSAAADGILTPDEQSALLRPRKSRLTEADTALVDEARVHLGPLRRPVQQRREPEIEEEERWMIERMLDDLEQTEPIIRAQRGLFAERYLEQRRDLDRPAPERARLRDRFGYVIVDEAQGLSPMQWRMIARRSRSGRMTVLGDLGQAGESAAASWEELLAPVDAPSVTVAELTINYRTPAEIMDLAARVLAAAAPEVAPPRSVRSTGEAPVFVHVPSGGVVEGAVGAAHAERERVTDGKVAIVTAESFVEELASAMGLDIAHLDAGGLLDVPVTVLALDDARGLEFDAVIVADPQAIVDESPGGLRALYVALTRPTQRLAIVHDSPLPEPIRGPEVA